MPPYVDIYTTRDVSKVRFVTLFHEKALLQTEKYNGITKYKLWATFQIVAIDTDTFFVPLGSIKK